MNKKDNYKYIQKGERFLIEVLKNKKGNWFSAYMITLDANELIKCSCPGFKYHNKQCKHVDEVIGYLKTEEGKSFGKKDKDGLEKFEAYTELQIADQWMYHYARKAVGVEKAVKLVNKIRKLFPPAPWGNEIVSLDDIINVRKMVEEKADKTLGYKELQSLCEEKFGGVRLILKKLKEKGVVAYEGEIPNFNSIIRLIMIL